MCLVCSVIKRKTSIVVNVNDVDLFTDQLKEHYDLKHKTIGPDEQGRERKFLWETHQC